MKNFTKQDIAYFDYIAEHKKNLLIAYNIMMNTEYYANTNNASIIWLDETDRLELRDRVIAHDLSKYSKEQFEGYRQMFFSREGEPSDEELFEKAWENHYIIEKHHPEGHKLPMVRVDIYEMMLDWVAMSIKFKSSSLEYYRGKKQKLQDKFKNIIDFELIDNMLHHIDYEKKIYDKNKEYDLYEAGNNWVLMELK